MSLISLQLPAGVYRNGTEYQAKGRWRDSNLVRWFEGSLRPIGGWFRLKADYGTGTRVDIQFDGSARGAHAWRSLNSMPYLSIGTNLKLYARSGFAGPPLDISPVDFTPGLEDTQINFGYGGGSFGYEAFGTPRVEVTLGDLAHTWQLDNFGEFLVAVSSSDRRLLYWDLVAPTAVPVVAVAGTTPINNLGVIVTDERFVFLLGAGGNDRRIAWSDQEDLFNWEITATTQAGDFELQTTGIIKQAVKTRGETLIFTTEDVHRANYLGPPLIYGFERVGDGCGVVSPHGAVAVDNSVIWMGEETFFRYDGRVSPLPCEVQDFVFRNINRSQREKVWATHNPDFGEVSWFYPVGNECDNYVVYNYRENHWATGILSRTTGVDNSVFSNPQLVSGDKYLYQHETGYQYEGAMPFAETGPIELGQGDVVYMTKYIYPDERTATQNSVQAFFDTRFYPNDQEYAFGPFQMDEPTSVRFTGRQIVMKIEGIQNTDWRVGVPRLDVETGGVR